MIIVHVSRRAMESVVKCDCGCVLAMTLDPDNPNSYPWPVRCPACKAKSLLQDYTGDQPDLERFGNGHIICRDSQGWYEQHICGTMRYILGFIGYWNATKERVFTFRPIPSP